MHPLFVIPATERQVSAGNAYREGKRESKLQKLSVILSPHAKHMHLFVIPATERQIKHIYAPFCHSREGGNPIIILKYENRK
jgi:hypothetical protein